MSDQSLKAFNEARDAMEKACEHLRGADYFEFLEELSGHLECLIDCYKEEHPEDFE